MSSEIDWNDVVKKEARGISDDDDLGEVQEVGQTHIITQKGLFDKVLFKVPKDLVDSYDGNTLRFRITEDEARNSFMQNKDHTVRETSSSQSISDRESEEIIPVMGENLDVSKRIIEQEVKIIKEPVKETKTVELQLTHEEIIIERRPSSAGLSELPSSTSGTQSPVDTISEITIPLKYEEPIITKTPFIKEEIVLKKEVFTETRTITEEIRSENATIEGAEEKEREEGT